MKLIPLIILTICLEVNTEAQESFKYSPQFQGSQSGRFSSEKEFYLPPESQTVSPFYPLKNFNILPFPYLPTTVTKSSIGTPSPFPIAVSTTLLPMTTDDDKYDNKDKSPARMQPYLRNQYNRTQRGALHQPEKREIRPIPKYYQNPIDRIDTKLPIQFSSNSESTTHTPSMQSMSPRSIMISDIQRDHNLDQMKSASYLGGQYVSQPGVFLSTTETAIPILRLSNEMDLDGSFSYEALGADQTHYVQHSRMESNGADKEEQVVEGSYSYVGDNGKTYTVHYIADSNGFRASGEHLPVPPPVPEIIQRAVQYNLAEELKKPQHLKSWNEEEKENDLSDSEKQNRFAVSPPRLSNLFTGKTPESFSHSSLQGSNTQNNLVTAASSQTPIQIVDYNDQMANKQNSGTISPQITFMASQGAHNPSVNSPQHQQSLSNTYTTERPLMPLIVNYQANTKDTEQDSNKALWRWQYGINVNSNMDKNLISRSSGEDDISINFSDMTADQYTKMLQQQLEANIQQSSEAPQFLESATNQGHYGSFSMINSNSNGRDVDLYNSYNFNTVKPVPSETTENISLSTHSTDLFKYRNSFNRYKEENAKELPSEISQTSRPKLLTQNEFLPRSQTVTQNYNYDENSYESRKTRFQNDNNMNLNVLPLNWGKHMNSKTTPQNIKNEYVFEIHEKSTVKPISKIKFSDFIVSEDDSSDFKPVFSLTEPQPKEISTTTEINIENMLEENIFLKNVFRNNKFHQEKPNKTANENKQLQVKPNMETKSDKYANPKHTHLDSKPYNEIKTLTKKPMDIADVMNYLSRNQFESARVKSKPQQFHSNMNQNIEIPHSSAVDNKRIEDDKNIRNLRTLQQNEELRGAIKNYKILQRNNKIVNAEHDKDDRFNRNLSPSPAKVVHPPPLGRAGPLMKTYVPPVYV